MRDLFSEYVAESPDLMPFFARPRTALFATPPKTGPWEASLAEGLGIYQERLGKRHRFLGDEAVVMTGQQPGIFTGPLYTIYKAATAVALARRIHDRFGTRCVPMFWVASDDHDFEETRTTHFLTKTHETLSTTYEPEDYLSGLPMHRVPIEPSLHALVDLAATQTPGSEYRAEISQFLHDTIGASASLADWTARLMARLFRDTPLVIFAPHLEAARLLAVPIFERELREPLESTASLNETGAQLRALGFPQQIAKGDDECCFFIEMGDRRRKVLYEDGRFVLPEESIHYTLKEMLALLESAPDRFSANVALRTIVQQHLFPVAAYVAGPGELAYWAQLKPIFQRHGKEMPVVYPRARATLTSTKLRAIMDKFGFRLEELGGPQEALIDRALQTAANGPALDLVQQYRHRIKGALSMLPDELSPYNKTAASMADKVLERVDGEFEKLQRAVAKGDEAQADAVRKQVVRVTTALFPQRRPQERIYNVFSFLFEHGWDLIPRLVKELDVDSLAMKEIEL